MRITPLVVIAVACNLGACTGIGSSAAPTPVNPVPIAATAPSEKPSSGNREALGAPLRISSRISPVGMRVDGLPVPVKGSDGQYHIVYEIALTNFTKDSVAVDTLAVIDPRNGTAIASLDRAQIERRLVVPDRTASPGRLGAAQAGLLYVHLVFETKEAVPESLEHQLSATVGSQEMRESAATIPLAAPTDLVVDSPLRGLRYIASDGCCDAPRHVRASIPLDGRMFTAQRFAIDWEQLDSQGRLYVGNPKEPTSYVIYGKPVYAVSDATVVSAVDGRPDSPIGSLPGNIDEANGNHVLLDFGNTHFALYAHLKPNSVRVHDGDRIHRGDVLGLVGTSGNSSEPHLHFQITDGPSPLASNGVPYRLHHFVVTHRAESTEAVDRSILSGQPLVLLPVDRPSPCTASLPLDLSIVDLDE